MSLLEAAQSYVRAGLSVIPCHHQGANGKRPKVPWKDYQSRIAGAGDACRRRPEEAGIQQGIFMADTCGAGLSGREQSGAHRQGSCGQEPGACAPVAECIDGILADGEGDIQRPGLCEGEPGR